MYIVGTMWLLSICAIVLLSEDLFLKGKGKKPESRYNTIVWAKVESLPLVHLNLLTGDVFNGDPIKSIYAVSASKLFTFSSNDR